MKKIVIVLMVLLVGCSEAETETDINMVRNGVLRGYETTTVGQAFEGSFDDWIWKEFTTDKGQRIVEFNGLVSEKLHDTFVEWVNQNIGHYQDLFRLAEYYGVTVPPELDGDFSKLEEAMEWVINRLWAPGTPFIAQFAILVGDQRMKIVYMDMDGTPFDAYWSILGMIYR